jgi:hypothetical protein
LGVISISLILLIIFRHLWNLLKSTYIKPYLKGLIIGYNIMFVQYFIESFACQIYNSSLHAFIFFSGIGILENLIEQKEEQFNKI